MSILKVQEIQHTNATSALTISTGGNVTVPSGDLIVDTNTLVVDASANKVGIGTASPATAELDVSGKTGRRRGCFSALIPLMLICSTTMRRARSRSQISGIHRNI